MRTVQVTVMMQVADDVTDEQLLGWLPSIAAVVEEPVHGHDGSDNEQRFDSERVLIDVAVDGRELTSYEPA